MDQREMMNKLDAVIDDAKAAVLATTDGEGRPHLRWLTPGILKNHSGAIYCFTRPVSMKILELESHRDVEWMFQTRSLGEVVNVRGTIEVINNAALKSELMEIIGVRLTAFWKADLENTDFVVLETMITEATYYQPMTGKREKVIFK